MNGGGFFWIFWYSRVSCSKRVRDKIIYFLCATRRLTRLLAALVAMLPLGTKVGASEGMRSAKSQKKSLNEADLWLEKKSLLLIDK